MSFFFSKHPDTTVKFYKMVKHLCYEQNYSSEHFYNFTFVSNNTTFTEVWQTTPVWPSYYLRGLILFCVDNCGPYKYFVIYFGSGVYRIYC